MSTLTKKVFLSSTFIDLKKYRAAAVHLCQRVGLIPIYMEDFPPDPRDASVLLEGAPPELQTELRTLLQECDDREEPTPMR